MVGAKNDIGRKASKEAKKDSTPIIERYLKKREREKQRGVWRQLENKKFDGR